MLRSNGLVRQEADFLHRRSSFGSVFVFWAKVRNIIHATGPDRTRGLEGGLVKRGSGVAAPDQTRNLVWGRVKRHVE